MLKQSHMNNNHDYHHLHLYDKVRQDLFEERQNQPKKVRAPSITTIFLLQIQAYIVQLLFNLPPVEKNRNHNALSSSQPSFFLVYQLKRLHIITSIRSIVRHCLRWILLAALLILDNIARVLNVEREMFEINNQKKQDQLLKKEKKPMNNTSYHIEEDEDEEEEDFIQSSTTEDTYHDDYYLQKKSSFNLLHQKIDQCTNNNKRGNTNGMNSEPSSPTLQKKFNNNNGYYSPVHSPTPNFIRSSTTNPIAATTPTTPTSSRPSSAIIQKEFSPNLNPSRANYNRARSLSNNMIDQTNKQQKLRRITGQREITVQNAILPIPSRNSTSKKPPTKASSVASRSSSSESSQQIKPKMQKTQSLSTAQQYHQQHHHHHHHHTNESNTFKIDLKQPLDIKRPYERCCPACVSH